MVDSIKPHERPLSPSREKIHETLELDLILLHFTESLNFIRGIRGISNSISSLKPGCGPLLRLEKQAAPPPLTFQSMDSLMHQNESSVPPRRL